MSGDRDVEPVTDRHSSSRIRLALVGLVVSCAVLVGGASPAWAGTFLNVRPDLPPQVKVPAKDADPTTPGVQTDQVAAAVVFRDDGRPGFGLGPTQTTVLPAPQIAVTKSAAPPSRFEPGGLFTFTVEVSNPSTNDSIAVTSLLDSIYGDLATRPGSTCGAVIGDTLPPGAESAPCSFTGPFTGVAGASQTDTVTVSGDDSNGNTATATAMATVTILPVALIAVTKVASPVSRAEPGGTFTFTARVSNPSAVDPIKITSLSDDIYGDLATRPGSTCGVLIGVTLPPGGKSAPCSFTGPFRGEAGDAQTDTVMVNGADANGSTAAAAADATVRITAVPLATQVAPATITLGGAFRDTATLSPAGGAPAPTGSVVFSVYGPGDAACAGPVVSSSTGPLNAAGATAVSGLLTPTRAGTYRVVAVYGGNATYSRSSSACTDPKEAVVVSRARVAIATQVSSASMPLGGSFHDVATLGPVPSGAAAPTGTVTFRLFGPGDRTCSGPVGFTSIDPVNAAGTGARSGAPAPSGMGTFRMVAIYGGDANYVSSASACGDPAETVGVTPRCDQTIGPTPGSVTLRTPVAYCIKGARIVGSVTVPAGASLYVAASKIDGGVTARGGGAFYLCDSAIGAGVTVRGATGFVLIGDGGDDGGDAGLPACGQNTIAGSVSLIGNTAGFELGGNQIGAGVSASENTGSGPAGENGAPEIEGDEITASLTCRGNLPRPVNGGEPNAVGGADTCGL